MTARVKFCGMTRREDLEAAAGIGVDAVGLVFVPGTPRNLDLDRARELVRGLPPFLGKVGVFADSSAARVRRIREALGLTAVQLHGRETPEQCAAVGGVLIKSFPVTENWDPSILTQYECEACLLEMRGSVKRTAAGVTFDWRRWVGKKLGRRIILAGGLTPENVAEAVRGVRPYAVDVSRGIESAPGIKDRDRMVAFLEAVRSADE